MAPAISTDGRALLHPRSRPTERAVALMRLSKAGAMLTTYESLLFELMGNAKAPNFKAVSALIKEPRPEPELPFMHMAAL